LADGVALDGLVETWHGAAGPIHAVAGVDTS
jgi:hypothetical protein